MFGLYLGTPGLDLKSVALAVLKLSAFNVKKFNDSLDARKTHLPVFLCVNLV